MHPISEARPGEPLAIAPFERWTYSDALNAMKKQLRADYSVVERYVKDHDHYQDGSQWVGPGTATRSGKIADQFAPDDAVGEVITNVENAFEEPQVGTAPLVDPADGSPIPEATRNAMAEAEALLSAWWDKRRVHEMVMDRQRQGVWAGYAALRVWVPSRFLMQDGQGAVQFRIAADVAEALDYIHLSAPDPEHGVVVTDMATMDQVGLFFSTEVAYEGDKVNSYEKVEMVYLDPERERDEEADTIVRVVYADPEKRRSQRAVVPLGGKLTIAAMTNRILITDPVVRVQRQLNLASSLLTRIMETAAFRERYTMNAKPQGIRIPYTPGDTLRDGAFLERDDEGREWQVVPQPRTLGANTTTELIGLPEYNDRAEAKGHTTPQVFIADPVDPGPYIHAADAIRRKILRMCGQGHLGGISNAEASGIAYEQARAVFAKDLDKRRVAEEGMLRDILTTVLRMAEYIADEEGRFTDVIRVTVDQHVNPGPRSPDLVRLDLEAGEAGVLSDETVMARMGVEDIHAEKIRVQKSTMHILRVLEKVAQASNAFTTESMIEALRQLELPEGFLDALVQAETENSGDPRIPDGSSDEGGDPFQDE